MPETYIERILRARVYDVARESPLTSARLLSRRLGNQVLLKREDLQSGVLLQAAGRLQQDRPPGRADAGAGRDRRLRRQPRPGGGAGGRATGNPGDHRHAADHARDQGPGGARTWARGRCCTATTYDEAYAHAMGLVARARADLHPPLRRPGRDRRPGYHRHGDPAPAPGAARRHLRARGRRRSDRRHCGLREVRARRRCGSSAWSPRTPPTLERALHAGAPGEAGAGRALCRRRCGARHRQGDLPDRSRERWTRWCSWGPTRSAPPSRTSSTTPVASPSPPARWRSQVSNATWSRAGSSGRAPGRHRQRRQHQLRPPAPRGRARRARRAARGPARA